jgi:hypothetical protein
VEAQHDVDADQRQRDRERDDGRITQLITDLRADETTEDVLGVVTEGLIARED